MKGFYSLYSVNSVYNLEYRSHWSPPPPPYFIQAVHSGRSLYTKGMLMSKLYEKAVVGKLTNEDQGRRKRILVCVEAHLREDLLPHLKRHAAV